MEEYWTHCKKCGAILITVPESTCSYCSNCGGLAYEKAVEEHHATLVALLQDHPDGKIMIPLQELEEQEEV